MHDRPAIVPPHRLPLLGGLFLGRVLFIVRVKLLCLGHHSTVKRMRFFPDHLHHNRLAHLGGRHSTDLGAAAACLFRGCCLCHLLLPLLGGCRGLLLCWLGRFALYGRLCLWL